MGNEIQRVISVNETGDTCKTRDHAVDFASH